MNIGYQIAMAEQEENGYNSWDCFVFHDLDMLPLDQRNTYNCSDRVNKETWKIVKQLLTAATPK